MRGLDFGQSRLAALAAGVGVGARINRCPAPSAIMGILAPQIAITALVLLSGVVTDFATLGGCLSLLPPKPTDPTQPY